MRYLHFIFSPAILFSTLTLTGQPFIASFSPTTGPAATIVTMTGSNFNLTPANNIVYFGSVRGTVSSATSTSLDVIVPSGATYQPITVTTNDLTAYSSKPFNVIFAGAQLITTSSFADKLDYSMSGHPYSTAIADLDTDGKPDIIAVNDANELSVYRNVSLGGELSFASSVDYSTAGWPAGMAVGDLDGDGRLDVVVCNFHLDLISVFRNTSTSGNLSFASRVDYPTGPYPYGVAIADFNGDGKPDIAASDNDWPVGYISIFTNQSTLGTISLSPKVDYATPNYARGLAVADLDADGKLDLISANQAGSVSVFRNTSTAGNPISFASRVDYTMPTGSSPESVSLGDLDGDGRLDLAIANNSDGTISLLRNTGSIGTISFAARLDYNLGGYPFSIAIGNLNGDDKPDIAVTNQLDNNKVSVLRNTSISGSLSFDGKIDFPTESSPRSVSVGDLNGDGAPELLVGNQGALVVSVLKNQMLVPLPLDFIDLEAKKEVNGVILTWTVQGEEDGQNYEVEKSIDGLLFEKLGLVLGSKKAQYSFTDNQVRTKNLYRIKATDRNGQKKYSNVVAVSVDASITLNAFPNPAQSHTTIRHPIAKTNTELLLLAADGKTIKRIQPKEGSQQTSIDVSFLSAGVYLICYREGTESQFIKLTKQ